ncbi:hypothetical protein [Pseudalkalibacillus decolorationis]|uniref:hypothetical protein n=1 Tax=Pseudalkalibacillus decolorationis TaxID=163879 RepID=UPI002147E936|nr:hypothetical protein [Pseudalkalibacillus decolorationis]
MHSRHTVIYICEEYPSGNCYYYKRELITHDSWLNIDSIAWSAPRPISKRTFIERKRAGYRTEHRKIHRPPAKIYPFPPVRNGYPAFRATKW